MKKYLIKEILNEAVLILVLRKLNGDITETVDLLIDFIKNGIGTKNEGGNYND